jgi:hypothetical protein
MTANYKIKISIIVSLFFIIVCVKKNEFQKIKNGDFSIVTMGTYHGKPVYIGQGREYQILVNDFRDEIDRNKEILPMITRKYFLVAETLIYKFKYVAIDKEKNYLILRYFARVMNHPVYAGYQVQFIFDITKRQLVDIYTAEVPLE